jgi:hypothetical protein
MQNTNSNAKSEKIKLRTYTELHRGFTELHGEKFVSVVLCASPSPSVTVLKIIIIDKFDLI